MDKALSRFLEARGLKIATVHPGTIEGFVNGWEAALAFAAAEFVRGFVAEMERDIRQKET